MCYEWRQHNPKFSFATNKVDANGTLSQPMCSIYVWKFYFTLTKIMLILKGLRFLSIVTFIELMQRTQLFT